jgi:cation transport ATPase
MTTSTFEVGDFLSVLGAHGIERQLRRVAGVGSVSVSTISGAMTAVYPFLLGPSIAALAMSGSSALVAINALMLKRTTLTGLHQKSATVSAA